MMTQHPHSKRARHRDTTNDSVGID